MTRDEAAIPSAHHPPFAGRLDADRMVMALMSPATTDADVDRHTEVFEAAVGALFA